MELETKSSILRQWRSNGETLGILSGLIILGESLGVDMLILVMREDLIVDIFYFEEEGKLVG